VNENFAAAHERLSLSDEDLAQLARNSFEAAFLPPAPHIPAVIGVAIA
jgi:adenosine deaminase